MNALDALSHTLALVVAGVGVVLLIAASIIILTWPLSLYLAFGQSLSVAISIQIVWLAAVA